MTSRGDGRVFSADAATALHALPEACLVTDAAQSIVFANSAFTATTGFAADEVLGRNCRFLQGPDTDADAVRTMRSALEGGRPFSGAVLNYRKDGEAFWNDLSIAPLRDERGEIRNFISVQRDATARVRAEARARDLLQDAETQRATLSALLDITRVLAGKTSTKTVLRSVAAAILTLCGADRASIATWDTASARLSTAEVAGWPLRLDGTIRAFTLSPEESPELAGIIALREPVLVTRTGASDWGRAVLDDYELDSFAAVPFEADDVLAGVLVACWADGPGPSRLEPDLHARLAGLGGITATAVQTARLVDQVRWSATHDPLTGLANRELLESELDSALSRLPLEEGLAVIFCDVDGFKRTNDSYGHAVGDTVLREIAARLTTSLREGDLVARIGGDEFLILLAPVLTSGEVDAVLGRLHRALAGPIRARGTTVRAHLSTGVAHVLPHAPRPSAAAVVQAADADMYRRKRTAQPTGAAAPRRHDPELGADLARAVSAGQITAYYQPQLDLRTGRVVAVEALARWVHPQLGVLEPDRFIPLAEASGIIHTLGRAVLQTACRAGVEARRHLPELRMSVNVSRRELTLSGYVDRLREALGLSGLPAEALTLEITESHLASDPALLRKQAEELRREGVRIALDDFGTGYTAIAQLQNIPITELKIDRAFVQQTPSPGSDLVAGITALAHELHLAVVAEGVETSAQLAHLRSIGCDRAQGFAIGAPLPLADLTRLARSLARRGAGGASGAFPDDAPR